MINNFRQKNHLILNKIIQGFFLLFHHPTKGFEMATERKKNGNYLVSYTKYKSLQRKARATMVAAALLLIFSAVSVTIYFPGSLNFLRAATTYYVNGATGNDLNNGTSAGTAFATISQALNVVANGDSIEVAAGTYTDDLDGDVLGVNNLTITGADAASTIITNNGATASLNVQEDDFTISGFTFNGTSPDARLYLGNSAVNNSTIQNNIFTLEGGIGIQLVGDTSGVTINNNTFIGNSGSNTAITVQGNATNLTVNSNTASTGTFSALFTSTGTLTTPTINNNTWSAVSGNHIVFQGTSSSPTISGNTFSNASDTAIKINGAATTPTITQNTIFDNIVSIDVEAAISNADINRNIIYNNTYGIIDNGNTTTASIINNTIYNNTNYGIGFGASTSSDITIKNNIITDNGVAGIGADASLTAVIISSYNNYNNIANWSNVTQGTGDISQDPLFTSVVSGSENFILQSGSPSVDTGDPASTYSLEPTPNGSRINQGAYGNTASATVSVTPLANIYVNATDGDDSTGDGSSSSPFQTLNKSITYIQDGSTIHATGTFTEQVSLTSSHSGSSGSVVTFQTWSGQNAPMINANGQTNGFSLNNTDYVTISGFTIYDAIGSGIYIQNGSDNVTVSGSTIYSNGSMGIEINNSLTTTISNNTIYNNTNQGLLYGGSGTGAVIVNNIIYGQTTSIGIDFRDSGTTGQATNNTLYNNATGIGFNADLVVNIKNNIIDIPNQGTGISSTAATVTNLTSNYNNLYLEIGGKTASVNSTNYSTLSDWQTFSSQDTNSISSDPLFISTSSGSENFHLQSKYNGYNNNSPSIDTGNPSDNYSNELSTNGSRINQGAYGNTVTAAQTSATPIYRGPGVDVISPSPVTNFQTVLIEKISESYDRLTSIKISWTDQADDGSLLGNPVSSYVIKYSTTPITSENDFENALAYPQSLTGEMPGTIRTLTLTDLLPDTTYYIALKSCDEILNCSSFNTLTAATTGSEEETTEDQPLAETTETTTPQAETPSVDITEDLKIISPQIPEGAEIALEDEAEEITETVEDQPLVENTIETTIPQVTLPQVVVTTPPITEEVNMVTPKLTVTENTKTTEATESTEITTPSLIAAGINVSKVTISLPDVENITNNTTPTLKGQIDIPVAGVKVDIIIDNVVVDTAITENDGSFNYIPVSPLTEGKNIIRASVHTQSTLDEAPVESTTSVMIDLTPPKVPWLSRVIFNKIQSINDEEEEVTITLTGHEFPTGIKGLIICLKEKSKGNNEIVKPFIEKKFVPRLNNSGGWQFNFTERIRKVSKLMVWTRGIDAAGNISGLPCDSNEEDVEIFYGPGVTVEVASTTETGEGAIEEGEGALPGIGEMILSTPSVASVTMANKSASDLPGAVKVTLVVSGTNSSDADTITLVVESETLISSFSAKENGDWTHEIEADLEVGYHHIYAQAIDANGNYSDFSNSLEFKLTGEDILSQCSDFYDNDRDGDTDLEDEDCENSEDNLENFDLDEYFKEETKGQNEEIVGSVVNTITKQVEKIAEIPVVKMVQEEVFDNPQVEKVTEEVAAPALAVVAAANTAAAATSAGSLLVYLQFLFTQPLMLLARRKKKGWGIVYNALSKKPVSLAVIRLFDRKTNKNIQTRVTDDQGRYQFIVNPGKYYLMVTKPEYLFPTTYLRFKNKDLKYVDLYHGDSIEIEKNKSIIALNVPLDPAIHEKPAPKIIWGYLLKKTQHAIAFSGVILAATSFIISPLPLLFGLLCLHILLYLAFRKISHISRKPKSWGIVYDKNKKPLSQAIVRIYDQEFNRLLETQVTDKKGRYSFLVGQNEYYLTVEKKGYKTLKSESIDLKKREGGGVVAMDLNI